MDMYLSADQGRELLRLVDCEIKRFKKLLSRDDSDFYRERIDSLVETFNVIAGATPISSEAFKKIYAKYGSSDPSECLTADWYTIFTAEGHI